MIIIGAGMAGLLAAHYFRHDKPVVYEAAPGPVNNHSAVLRLRSDAIASLTGIPLKKVTVRKAIMERDGTLTDRCSLLHANAYSVKVATTIMDRSIHNLAPVERWVPPPDFAERLREGVDVAYGIEIAPNAMASDKKERMTISTAPMRMFVENGLQFPEKPQFEAMPITVIACQLYHVDVHQTIYVPFADDSVLPGGKDIYRISVVGDLLIVEFAGIHRMEDARAIAWAKRMLNAVMFLLFGDMVGYTGVVCMQQNHGKIVPLPDQQRRALIGAITEQFGVYSLGRFATWRQLLLDDVVKDLGVIKQLIDGGDYRRRVHYSGANS